MVSVWLRRLLDVVPTHQQIAVAGEWDTDACNPGQTVTAGGEAAGVH